MGKLHDRMREDLILYQVAFKLNLMYDETLTLGGDHVKEGQADSGGN